VVEKSSPIDFCSFAYVDRKGDSFSSHLGEKLVEKEANKLKKTGELVLYD
jgi:hypothetical protein